MAKMICYGEEARRALERVKGKGFNERCFRKDLRY